MSFFGSRRISQPPAREALQDKTLTDLKMRLRNRFARRRLHRLACV
jgi:hypothetical protein